MESGAVLREKGLADSVAIAAGDWTLLDATDQMMRRFRGHNPDTQIRTATEQVSFTATSCELMFCSHNTLPFTLSIVKPFLFPDWRLHKFPRPINGSPCAKSDNWRIVWRSKYLCAHDIIGRDGGESAGLVHRVGESCQVAINSVPRTMSTLGEWGKLKRISFQGVGSAHVSLVHAFSAHWKLPCELGAAEECGLRRRSSR